MRVYARCMTGLEDVWLNRMDDTLHLEDDPSDNASHEAYPQGEDPQR